MQKKRFTRFTLLDKTANLLNSEISSLESFCTNKVQKLQLFYRLLKSFAISAGPLLHGVPGTVRKVELPSEKQKNNKGKKGGERNEGILAFSE